MDDYSAYQSSELAELYDVVYADSADVAFWQAMAPTPSEGRLLELGCGTGRVLLPLARAGHEVVGIDVSEHMLAHGRAKLQLETREVRDRVTLLDADMTSFELPGRFAQIFCAFGTFHHLTTVGEQLACLERCRQHLLPGGTLVLDLINPDPATKDESFGETDGAPEAGDMSTPAAGWTAGRQVRGWATVRSSQRALQLNDCEVTYEIVEADATTRRISETFPMRFLFRYELEHLLARCGFRIVALYGDYDCSAFADDSPGMIVVAEPLQC
jgi:SAM-dependent methyltransferase